MSDNEEYVDVSSLSEMGEFTPVGDYTVKLINIIPKKSAKNNPMIEAHWEIDGGDCDGNIIRDWLTFSVYTSPKTGKKSCGAITTVKNLRALVGMPIPDGYAFPLNEIKAGKELQPVYGKKLLARVYHVTDKEDAEKKYTRVKIKGAVGGTSAAAGTDLSDYA